VFLMVVVWRAAEKSNFLSKPIPHSSYFVAV